MTAQQECIRIPAAFRKAQQTRIGFARIAGCYQRIGKSECPVLVTGFMTELLKPFGCLCLCFDVEGQRLDPKLCINRAEVALDPVIPVGATSDGECCKHENDKRERV